MPEMTCHSLLVQFDEKTSMPDCVECLLEATKALFPDSRAEAVASWSTRAVWEQLCPDLNHPQGRGKIEFTDPPDH